LYVYNDKTKKKKKCRNFLLVLTRVEVTDSCSQNFAMQLFSNNETEPFLKGNKKRI
jgi:hypothetical protein